MHAASATEVRKPALAGVRSESGVAVGEAVRSRASNFFRGLPEPGAGLVEQWLCKNYYRGYKHKGDTHEEGHRWRCGYAHTLACLSVCAHIRTSERARTCRVAGCVHAWVYVHVCRLVGSACMAMQDMGGGLHGIVFATGGWSARAFG